MNYVKLIIVERIVMKYQLKVQLNIKS